MPTVSIVVPTYRRAPTLSGTLSALLEVDYPQTDYEVIVVDDGMDAATADLVETLRSGPVPVTLVRQHRQGAATARNAGARVAEGDVLLFCDDDIIVGRDHLKLHIATRATHGDVLVGGTHWYSPASLAAFETTPFGRYRVELERKFLSGHSERPLGGSCFEVATLSSCDLSLERQTFWGLGGFDESFPFAGVEDQDLSGRAARAGLPLVRNRAIKTLHAESKTTLWEFCQREEQGAHTMVALGRTFPEYLGDFRTNGPIDCGDEPAIVAKKLAKSLLSTHTSLAILHRLIRWSEQAGLSDQQLWRAYRVVLGLHLFRGYREALRRG